MVQPLPRQWFQEVGASIRRGLRREESGPQDDADHAMHAKRMRTIEKLEPDHEIFRGPAVGIFGAASSSGQQPAAAEQPPAAALDTDSEEEMKAWLDDGDAAKPPSKRQRRARFQNPQHEALMKKNLALVRINNTTTEMQKLEREFKMKQKNFSRTTQSKAFSYLTDKDMARIELPELMRVQQGLEKSFTDIKTEIAQVTRSEDVEEASKQCAQKLEAMRGSLDALSAGMDALRTSAQSIVSARRTSENALLKEKAKAAARREPDFQYAHDTPKGLQPRMKTICMCVKEPSLLVGTAPLDAKSIMEPCIVDFASLPGGGDIPSFWDHFDGRRKKCELLITDALKRHINTDFGIVALWPPPQQQDKFQYATQWPIFQKLFASGKKDNFAPSNPEALPIYYLGVRSLGAAVEPRTVPLRGGGVFIHLPGGGRWYMLFVLRSCFTEQETVMDWLADTDRCRETIGDRCESGCGSRIAQGKVVGSRWRGEGERTGGRQGGGAGGAIARRLRSAIGVHSLFAPGRPPAQPQAHQEAVLRPLLQRQRLAAHLVPAQLVAVDLEPRLLHRGGRDHALLQQGHARPLRREARGHGVDRRERVHRHLHRPAVEELAGDVRHVGGGGRQPGRGRGRRADPQEVDGQARRRAGHGGHVGLPALARAA